MNYRIQKYSEISKLMEDALKLDRLYELDKLDI